MITQEEGVPEVMRITVRCLSGDVLVDALQVTPQESVGVLVQAIEEALHGKPCKIVSANGCPLLPTDTIAACGLTDGATVTAIMGGDLDGIKANRIHDLPKLEDANLAGTEWSSECCLILARGDSAKSLALAGLSVVGRNRFGVYPLRGNLNVCSMLRRDPEISNIIKILGLEPKKEYASASGLRYGTIMLMTDNDYDGSHLKASILNFIQHSWPSLLHVKGFIKEFITPLVKVSQKGESLQFFTMGAYEKWKASAPDLKAWAIKYYKGLGASTTAEAKEYFRNINLHTINFHYEGEKDDDSIDLAFNTKRADDRKAWKDAADEQNAVDHSTQTLTYSDFVHKELVHAARYDNLRAIPSVVDGLKLTQRKVMHCSLRRNITRDIKVAHFASYISEHAAHHHGETSLQATIVSMAQTFVGVNNVNLLVPSGQFGTRFMGGQDAALARYMCTRLEPIARAIFHPDDDQILTSQNEEGQNIEPLWFMPVIPMILVNGAEGISNGCSTYIPMYCPHDVIANLKQCLRGSPMHEMHPWYRGFRGTIVPDGKDGYDVVGVVNKIDGTTIEITELPLRKWTQDYKEFLLSLMSEQGRGKILDFKEHHTDSTVHFVIKVSESQMRALEEEGLDKALRLRSRLSTKNMFLVSSEGKIRKYETVLEILEEFAQLRLAYYTKRKAYLVAKLRCESEILFSQVRFLRMVINGELALLSRKRDDVLRDLQKHAFRTSDEINDEFSQLRGNSRANERGAVAAPTASSQLVEQSGFDYLFGMASRMFMLEEVEEVEKLQREKAVELEKLNLTSAEEIWERDLNPILCHLETMKSDFG